MPYVVNCASTCTNHTSGSAVQNGGSLRLTAEIVQVYARELHSFSAFFIALASGSPMLNTLSTYNLE